MQNNLMKVEDDFQEENEINIYDIINIFIKNIKLFIIVSIIGLIATFLYIGKRIIFDKNNTIYINYTLNYQEINSYIGDNVYYPKKSPKEILLDNKYIELLFENPELKALYEEKVKEDRDSIDTKRQFLINNKILETSTIKELTKNKEEQDLILKTLDKRNMVDCIIYFTFFMGLRLGEVLGLQWDDINENMLTVKRQYRRVPNENKDSGVKLKYIFKDLKTKNSEREIPLPDKVLKMLKDLPRHNDLIFSDVGKPIEIKRPQRRITYLCKKLNIPHRSFHSIRHSYATRLFELDVPIKTVQVLMGHGDISTTMDIYTHVMKEKKLEVLDKLNNL